MKQTKKLLIGLLFVLVLAGVVLANALVVTKQNEYTVVRQFGEVVDVRSTPGISFKIPLIQTVAKLPNTVLLYDLPIADNGSVSNAESRLSTIVYNSMKNIISSRTQTDVISGRDGELAADIRDGVGDTLNQYGIQLIAVETKHLDLPDDNKEAVYQRMISERNNIAASYTAQGESEAQKIRSETDREVQVMLSEAQAQAEILIAEGEAEYMNILSDAYSDPAKAEFYSFVRALDAAKASLAGGENTLILSQDSPLAQIFYQAQ